MIMYCHLKTWKESKFHESDTLELATAYCNESSVTSYEIVLIAHWTHSYQYMSLYPANWIRESLVNLI